MNASVWADWLIAADEADCHSKLNGKEWEDGCCRIRRGRLVKLRLALWLTLVDRGYGCWVV